MHTLTPERPRSAFDLRSRDLKVKCDQGRSICISVDASRRAEHNESIYNYERDESRSCHVTVEVKSFFADNFLQKRDTDALVVSSCSARQDASNDIHVHLFWPNLTSRSCDLRSTFALDLSGPKDTFFDASRREEHDGVRIIVLGLSLQKLLAKNDLFFVGHRLTSEVTV